MQTQRRRFKTCLGFQCELRSGLAGKAPDFESGDRRFEPCLLSQETIHRWWPNPKWTRGWVVIPVEAGSSPVGHPKIDGALAQWI